MNLLQRLFGLKQPAPLPNEQAALNNGRRDTEIGGRATPENQVKYLYRVMWVDSAVRQAILDVREMDREDGRVKRIHARVARDVIKGGLIMQQAEDSTVLAREWQAFGRRLQLDRREKLRSDARGFVMEGNLPLQWVLDPKVMEIVAGVRMPSETIVPNVDGNGRFKDVRKAYVQFDVMTGAELASFALWNLLLARFDPDNYDDMGAMGRPFLDASRSTWRKLRMTDEDLVIRRRMRAPLRIAHVLEGASKEELDEYRERHEKDQGQVTTDYYSNRKGSHSAVQGDSNLDHIKDITYLLDTFFAGSPLPKGLSGFTDGLARDILEDLKRDYYDEIDDLQDTLAFAYEAGFRLQLMLKGINPDAEEFWISYAERRTETPNQAADRALKLKALGLPDGMVWEELGYDPAYVRRRREYEAEHYDPYPDPNAIQPATGAGRVKITPGNGRKGESGTSIRNR